MALCFLGFNGFQNVLLEHSAITKVEQIVPPSDSTLVSFSVSWSNFFAVRGDGTIHVGRIGSAQPACSWMANKYRKVACSDRYVALISATGRGSLIRRYSDERFEVVENLRDQLEAQDFDECDVGDSDAVFLSAGGKVFWINLKHPILETQILPLAWKVTEVSCGGKEHVILLNEFGTVYTFGTGSRGQLGHGDLEDEESPRPVEHLEGVRTKHISAGGWHSAAVTHDGDLYTWGWNESGQLGFPVAADQEKRPEESTATNSVAVQAVPAAVNLPEDVVAESVSCGSRHTLVRTADGQVCGFGWNGYSQLGVNSTDPVISTPTKLEVFAGARVSAVHCRGWCSIVVVDGSLPR